MFQSCVLALVVGLLSVLVQGDDGSVGVVKRAIRPNPSNGRWIDTWASMPQLTEPANLPPAPFNQTGAVFVNATIRQTLRVSVGASQIRLKISNAFGLTNLPVTAVTVALPANDTAGIHQIQPKTVQKITFSGKDSISIPNGALVVSDPLDFKVKPQSILSVTIYLQDGQTTNSITSHPGSRTTSFWQFGNAVSAATLDIKDATQSAAHWYFISSIEAWVPPTYGSLVVVGDSITDGRGSETNKNNRWPDLLLARLQKNPSTRHIGVANLAAGGNRVLADGLGPNALGRVDRDVLAHPGVQYVLVFEGVNDIGTADPTPSAQDVVYASLTTAYSQIVSRIHAVGIPVFGATITPFSSPANATVAQPYSHPEREKTRVRVNKWIEESGVFDAVVDFDKFLRDEKAPSRLDPRWDSGDYLHPSVAGYKRLAELFPVGVFQEWRGGADEFI